MYILKAKSLKKYTYMFRKYIYQRCLRNSFNPQTFASEDLECLFRHYDSLCFRDDFARRSQRRLCFASSPRRIGPLGKFRISRSELWVEVAPVVIASEFSRNPQKFKLLAGEPCETEGYGLLFILEHIFIHLLVEVFASRDNRGEIFSFSHLATHHFSHPPPHSNQPLRGSASRCILSPPLHAPPSAVPSTLI